MQAGFRKSAILLPCFHICPLISSKVDMIVVTRPITHANYEFKNDVSCILCTELVVS